MLALFLVAGCAEHPIVDMEGIEPAQYQHDSREFEAYAHQVNVGGPPAIGAVAGTVASAVVGTLF